MTLFFTLEEASAILGEGWSSADVENERRRIVRNAAKCLSCEEEIESKSVHDFVSCKCGNLSVDGGHNYIRRAWSEDRSAAYPSDAFEERSKYHLLSDRELREHIFQLLDVAPAATWPPKRDGDGWVLASADAGILWLLHEPCGKQIGYPADDEDEEDYKFSIPEVLEEVAGHTCEAVTCA